MISGAKPLFDGSCVKKSLSNVTYLADESNESDHKEQIKEEALLTPSPQRPDAMQLPGIFVTQFDPSDVDECDGGSSYYEEPRDRCQSYSAGGTRCTLMVHRAGVGSSCSSSAGLFASQRSLPWSSKCSSRLGVGDSGWDGDVSHDGSLSNVSHRDWTGGPCSDAVECSIRTSASLNFFLPLSLHLRHSASNVEQKLDKTSTSTFSGQRDGCLLYTSDAADE